MSASSRTPCTESLSRRVLRWLPTVWALLLASSSSPAQPGDRSPSLQIEWPSVDGCPTERHLRQMIARSLGTGESRTREISARVVIAHRALWQLPLSIDTAEGSGERLLQGESCSQLAEALAVILAMLVDPEAVRTTRDAGTHAGGPVAPEAGEGGWSRAEVHAVPSVELRGSVILERPSSTRTRFGIGVGPVIALGLQRTPRAGVGVGVDLSHGHWTVFANANYWPVQDVSLLGDQRRGAHASIGSMGIGMGRSIIRPPFELVARMSLAGYLTQATGYGVDEPISDSINWWAIGVGQVLFVELAEPFFLRAALDLYVPLARPAARLEPGGDVLRPAPVGAQAYLGPVWRY